jgi:type IV pilus assembly protein PilA
VKNKKGFTLVELLAVIAILAILVLISMPSIMSMYNKAKKDTFLNEVRNLLTGAESTFLSEALKNKKIDVVASEEELVNIAN